MTGRIGQLNKLALVAGLLLAGCTAVPPASPASPSAEPLPSRLLDVTPPPHPSETSSTQPTLPPDSGWQLIQPGLEMRQIRLFGEDGQQREEISVVRLDPALFEFKVAYRPGQPQTLTEWQAETEAQLVVNGGFFTESFEATGLTVVDGRHRGASYGDFAGMFAVTPTGPEVRWLGTRPYDFNEPLQYALQAFPMLVKPDGVLGYTEEDGDRARRTAVAQDGDGRILFIVAPWGSFTLYEFGRWLLASDLEIEVALNLDGGTSTGLLLAEPEWLIPAFTRLPVVITVTSK